MRRSSRSTSSWPTRRRCRTCPTSRRRQECSVPRWSWVKWGRLVAVRSTIRCGWRRRITIFSGIVRKGAMALTASVKEELSRLDIKKSSVRKAEVSAMLRFAGGLHIISGRIVIEAEVDLASTARRLRAAIAEVYGHQSEIIVVSGGGLRRGSRYVVRVVRDGEALARQTGLLDGRGRRVRGRCGSRLARSFPGPWIPHRTRTFFVPGSNLSRAGVRAGTGGCRPPAG